MEPLDPVFVSRLAKTQKKYVTDHANVLSQDKLNNIQARELKRMVRMAHRPDSIMSRWTDKADYKLTVSILDAINEASGFGLNELRMPRKRDHKLSVARSIFAYLERSLNNRSFPDIAALLDKDHTSCIYMVNIFRRNESKSEAHKEYMKNEKLNNLYLEAKASLSHGL